MANRRELETDWHTTINELGVVVVGVDLSGLCGCPSSLNTVVVECVCNFCPKGRIINETAKNTVDNMVMIYDMLRRGYKLSRCITESENWIIDPAKGPHCQLMAVKYLSIVKLVPTIL